MDIKKQNIYVLFIFVMILLSPFIFSQVIQTQVIDLSEKARNFFIEATKGNIQGQSTDNKFGENLNVGTSEEDIQSQGGTLIFLQEAEIINFSSTSGNDDIAGANARSIKIFGLDQNFTEINEIVNLSGTTSVNSIKKYIRIQRVKVNEVGTYGGVNTGTIQGTAFISGGVQIEIPATESQSQTTHYTVPAGKNLIMTSFRITMDTGKVVDVFINVRENADKNITEIMPIRVIRNFRGLDTPLERINFGNNKFEEKTDIWITALVSIGTAEVEANYDFLQYAIGT